MEKAGVGEGTVRAIQRCDTSGLVAPSIWGRAELAAADLAQEPARCDQSGLASILGDRSYRVEVWREGVNAYRVHCYNKNGYHARSIRFCSPAEARTFAVAAWGRCDNVEE